MSHTLDLPGKRMAQEQLEYFVAVHIEQLERRFADNS